jgi:hypothetical protein
MQLIAANATLHARLLERNKRMELVTIINWSRRSKIAFLVGQHHCTQTGTSEDYSEQQGAA